MSHTLDRAGGRESRIKGDRSDDRHDDEEERNPTSASSDRKRSERVNAAMSPMSAPRESVINTLRSRQVR